MSQRPHRDDDGYRYVRGYRVRGAARWALWERVNGKMRRVGTAYSAEAYLTFLRLLPEDFAATLAFHAEYGELAGQRRGSDDE
jgi:hypothetical protein